MFCQLLFVAMFVRIIYYYQVLRTSGSGPAALVLARPVLVTIKNLKSGTLWPSIEIAFVRDVSMCVYPLPRLLITRGVIRSLCDWLKKF